MARYLSLRILVFVFLSLCICVVSPLARPDTGTGDTNLLTSGDRSLTYAVVIKQSTYDIPDWRAVADALLARYPSQLFIWNSSLFEVQGAVGDYLPTHVGLVCELTTASPSFVQHTVWSFMRGLDTDIYCDAVWGILTGYDAADALRLATCPDAVEVRTLLSGTTSCDLTYYTQGISTSEATYGRYYTKQSDSETATEFNDGPTDRTEWLVTMINEGIDIFDHAPVDIFYTSGHGGHNVWQMHYPTSGLEGYFRSSPGFVYGDPYDGRDINIESTNPKIYFGLGNCDIGQIQNSGSMAPGWIHRGGAYQYTGYVIPEGGTSHQHGGTKAYFYRVSRSNTWAESYFLANQALRFDILNNTPGASPPDLNGSALYGDPAMEMVMSHDGVYREPLFSTELTVCTGATRDTVTYRITMNREGSPGYTSKWGERHPAIILTFVAEDIQIIYTEAMSTVVEDNFALMYIWYQGQSPLAEAETREVFFACNAGTITGVEESVPASGLIQCRNVPNPFNPSTEIFYTLPNDGQVTLRIYGLNGKLVDCLVDEVQAAGEHSVRWQAADLASGVYFYRVSEGAGSGMGKCVLLK